MTNNQVYIAIGLAAFTFHAVYTHNQEQHITAIENNITSIHQDVQDIKTIIVEQSAVPIKFTPQEFDCLARNIYYEAGIENQIGKLAVAQVTLNRMRTGRWGKDICSVVYAKAQFSWTRVKKRAWLQNKGVTWEASKTAATQALSYGMRVKPLEKSLFYHAEYVTPYWKDNSKRVAQIGTHIFYTQAKGNSLAL